MKDVLTRFANDESGATAIEYGLIAGGISLVILSAVQLIGTNIDEMFSNIAEGIKPSE